MADAHAGDVRVTEVAAVDQELVAAFERLVPQLSRSSPPPTAAELAEIVGTAGTVVLVARAEGGDGPVVGTLTLVTFRIPTGMRAWIEDVVVDQDAGRRGIGSALNRAALDAARARGCKTVDLTSRPSREVANRLYQRLGFEARDTNVYRYELEEVHPAVD
jgi:ribosomal protein S18 acetylase RimI-like enzyme